MAAQLSAYVLAKTEELARLEAELQALAAQAFAYCGGAPTHDASPFEDISESVKAAVRAALGAGLLPELPGFPANGLDQAKKHAPSSEDVAHHDSADVPLLKRLKASVEDALGNAKPTVNQLAANEVGQPQPPDRTQSIGGNEAQTSATARFHQASELPRVVEVDVPNIQNNCDSQSLDTRVPEARETFVQPPLGPDDNPHRKPDSSEDRAQPSESQHVSQPQPQQTSADLLTRKRPPLWLRQMLPSRSRPKLAAAMPPKPPSQPTRGKKAPPQDPNAPAEPQPTATANNVPLPSVLAPADAHLGGLAAEHTAHEPSGRQAPQQHGDDPSAPPLPPHADLNPVTTADQPERASAPPEPQHQTTGPLCPPGPSPCAAPFSTRPCDPNQQMPDHSAIEAQAVLRPLLHESSPAGSERCHQAHPSNTGCDLQQLVGVQISTQTTAVQRAELRTASAPMLAELPPSSDAGVSEPPGANRNTATGAEAGERVVATEPVAREMTAGELAGGLGVAVMDGTSLPPKPAVFFSLDNDHPPLQQRHQRPGRQSSPSPSAVSMEPPPVVVGVGVDPSGRGLGVHHHSAPSQRGSTQTVTAGLESATAPHGSLLGADSLQPPAAGQGWPEGSQQQEATSPEEGVRKKRKKRVEPLAAGEGGVTEGAATGRSKDMDAGIMWEELIDMPLASRMRKRPKAASAKEAPAMSAAAAAGAVVNVAAQVGLTVGTRGVTGLGSEPVAAEEGGTKQHLASTAVATVSETWVHAVDGVEVKASCEPMPEGFPLEDVQAAAIEAEAMGADGISDCGQSFGTAAATDAAGWAVAGDMGAGRERTFTPLVQGVLDDWSPPANAAAAAPLPASPRFSDPAGRDVGRGREPTMEGPGPFACEEPHVAPGVVFPGDHAAAAVAASGSGGLTPANSCPCQGGPDVVDMLWTSAAAAEAAGGAPTAADAGLTPAAMAAAEGLVGNATMGLTAATIAAAATEVPQPVPDACLSAADGNARLAPAESRHVPRAPVSEAMADVGFTGWWTPGMGRRAPQDTQPVPTGAVAGSPVLTLLEAIAMAAAAAAAASNPAPAASTSADSYLETAPGVHVPPHPGSHTMAPSCAFPTVPAHKAEGPGPAEPSPVHVQPPPMPTASTAAAHSPTGAHPLFARCSAPQGSTTSAPPPPPYPPPPLDPATEQAAIPIATFTTTANARTITTESQPQIHTAPTTATAAVSADRGFARDSFESYSIKQPCAAPVEGAPAAAGARPTEGPSSGLVHERHHKPAGYPCRRPPLVSQVDVPRDPHAALAAAAAALMAALEGDGEGGECELPDFSGPVATGFQAAHQQAAGPAPPPPPVHVPPRESEEAAAKRRAAEAARKAAARASESEEKAAKRRAVQAARSAMRRAAQPPEEAALKRKVHAARQAAYRKRRKEQRAQEGLDLHTSDVPDDQDYESSGQEDGLPLSGSVSQSLHDERSERQEDVSNFSHPNVASGDAMEGYGDGSEGLRQEGDTAYKPKGPKGSGTAPFSGASAAMHAVDTDEVSSPMREQGTAPHSAPGTAEGGAAACGLGDQAAGPYAAGDAVEDAAQAEDGPAVTGQAETGVGEGVRDTVDGEHEAQDAGVDGMGHEGGCNGGLGRVSSDNQGGDGTGIGSDTDIHGVGHSNMEHAAGERGDVAQGEEEAAGRPMSEVEQEEWRRRAAEIERQRAEAAAEREAARRARNAQRAAPGGGGGGSGGGGLISQEDLARRIRQRLEEHHQLATAAAAEAEAKEVIRSQVRARLQETHRKALDERSLSRLLKQLGALPKGTSLRSAEQRGKALKAAKIRFHPDKASGGLEARVYAEEVSKLLNSWEWL